MISFDKLCIVHTALLLQHNGHKGIFCAKVTARALGFTGQTELQLRKDMEQKHPKLRPAPPPQSIAIAKAA